MLHKRWVSCQSHGCGCVTRGGLVASHMAVDASQPAKRKQYRGCDSGMQDDANWDKLLPAEFDMEHLCSGQPSQTEEDKATE